MPVYVPHASDRGRDATTLSNVSSLLGVIAPSIAAWRVGGSAIVIAIPRHEVGSCQSGSAVAAISNTAGKSALVSGEGALAIDEVNSTYGAFTLLFALVAIVTFLLLARGLSRFLLPLMAGLLNTLSVAASYGILVLVFQHGIGMQALWGTKSYGAADALAPVLIFGSLLGVSMDYEVFILSRIRQGIWPPSRPTPPGRYGNRFQPRRVGELPGCDTRG